MTGAKKNTITLCLFVAMAGCGGGDTQEPGTTSPPTGQSTIPQVSLAASPAAAKVGETITLSWSSTAATACAASGAWTGDRPTTGTHDEKLAVAGAHAFTLTCMGAGGSDDASVTVMAQGAPASNELTAEPTGYREVKAIALADLDPALAGEAGLTVARDPGAADPAMEFALGDGNVLYYLAPAEQFDPSQSVLRLTTADGARQWNVTFPWISRVGDSLSSIGEETQDESWKVIPIGIDRSGRIGAELAAASFSLGFKLQDLPAPPDAALMEVAMETATGVVDLSAGFTLDAASGQLTMNPAGITALRTALNASSVVNLTFSLPTAGYAEVYGFEQTLTHAAGRVMLAVKNANGSAATDMAGKSFVAKGFNTGTTAFVTVDAGGKAEFGGLPADTYEVRQVLLASGLPLVGFAYLPNATAEVALDVLKPAAPLPGASASQVLARSALKSPPTLASTADPARARAPKIRALTVSKLLADYSVTATAASEGQLVATPVAFSVPKGTTRLGIHVEISSDEYPEYTTAQSRYNDLWLFNVQLPAPLLGLSQTGKVNQTHVTSGTIVVENCVDVSAAASAAAFDVGGQVAAQNVGDSSLPTSVTLSLTLGCQGTLQIKEFAGKDRSRNGHHVLYPRRKARKPGEHGNITGQYFSIPMKAQLPEGFGIPATLRYEPADAVITEVELLQKTGAGLLSLGKDYLSQATASPGKLSFAGLRLAPTVLAPLQERIQIVAVLRGSVGGAPAQSPAVPLTLGEYPSFTPVYLASELPGYDPADRFGTHDEPGGDSWATAAMADWMFTEGLRYNDFSAALVAQHGAPKYRSVLDHSGHSDAQQADLRYWDGLGGFSDPYNGSSGGQPILDLANAALQEVNSNAAAKPSLARLVAWISQNRSNLTGYANRFNVRQIYIGEAHIAQLLIQGRFTDAAQTAIPGLTKWTPQTGKSPKISTQKSHLDHWHVNTLNP
jgi:hypothetical protein